MSKANPQPWISIINYEYRDSVVSSILHSLVCIVSTFTFIYIHAFSRHFYPKRLTLHLSYSFYILSALAFPGNRTHDLGVANAMLYQLSYRKVLKIILIGDYLLLY